MVVSVGYRLAPEHAFPADLILRHGDEISLGQDAYDFIEWVAKQPWCNGVVGMIGISYFGSMQVFAAAERPPSLKAIFVSGSHFDFYETTYHGGIMWFMY
ncbi:MAG: CocE/NonD family hydrolase [Pusillimonas sp.]